MLYDGPKILDTEPMNKTVNVATDTVVKIRFDSDLSKNSLINNIFVLNNIGSKLNEIKISYSNRIISIIIPYMQPSETYTVTLKGINDPNNKLANKGICNLLGKPMLGDYTFCFTTSSMQYEIEQIIDGTPDNILIKSQPLFSFKTTKNTKTPVEEIELQVSTTNTFDNLIWESRIYYNESAVLKGICSNIHFKDGIYYWRAKVIGHGEGKWSDTWTFSIDTTKDTGIVDDDMIHTDISFPSDWNTKPEIIESKPYNDHSNVPTNTKTIFITFNKIIEEEEIKKANFDLVGEDQDESEMMIDHVVKPDIDIQYDYIKQTTTIVLSLPEYKEEDKNDNKNDFGTVEEGTNTDIGI